MLHSDHGGEVIDHIAPTDEPFQYLAVENRIANVAELRVSKLMTHLKVGGHIQNRHLMTLPQHCISQMGPQKTSPTCD